MVRFLCLAGCLMPVCASSNPLVNPGFESVNAAGELEGWAVLTELDPMGYGARHYAANFDAVRPTRGDGGQGGSAHCLGFPARGRWFCPVFAHSEGDGKPGNDGRLRGKAAAYQSLRVEPGRYRFGAWLRTADGDAWSAAFRLGWSTRSPPEYAHDDSTGIQWSRQVLAYKTDRLGTLEDRGEWNWHETELFEVREGEAVTVWIRFDYVNENQFHARWQADSAAILAADPPRGDAPAGTIWGIVKDLEDRPIPGVRVTLKDLDRRDMSAGNGTFAFRSLTPGAYQLEVDKQGWRPVIIEPDPIEVEEAGELRVEIVMRRALPGRAWRDVTDIHFQNTRFDIGPGGDAASVAYAWAYQDSGLVGDCGIDRSVGRVGPSLRLQGSGGVVSVYQDSLRALASRTFGPYRIRAWVKASPGSVRGDGFAAVSVIDEKEKVLSSSRAAVGSAEEWHEIRSGEVQVPSGEDLRLRIELSPGREGTLWFDEIRLETAGEN